MGNPPDRFGPTEVLGQGAFGCVYGAVPADGRAIAIKVMSPASAASPEAVWQFGSEYRKLARLHHPAFPAAIEEGRTPEGLPYYAMSRVDGGPPVGPLSAAEVRRILAGLGEAMAYLHGLGLVHGDLKPENVRLTPDGRVMVLDVGLMTPVGARREGVAGTLEYLAPEVFRKAPVAHSADLYALGCLATELWSGRVPFGGATPGDLARAHLLGETPAFAAGQAEDPALATLIARLLAKEPAQRPASARAMLAALAGESEEGLGETGLSGGRFIGRAGALDAWQRALQAPRTVWWVLAGASGLGKSRTLDEGRLAAQLAGRAWAGATCAGAADAPGSPVRAIVAQALSLAGRSPSEATEAWLSGRLTGALLDMDPDARKAALLEAASQDLAGATESLGGLAIGLDDWHLADSASQDFVAQLRRSPLPLPLAVALTIDPDALAPERLEALTPDLQPLAPFTPDEAEALVSARLGAALPPSLGADLITAGQGSPLLLDLMLEHLVASGQLHREADGWHHEQGAAAAGAGMPGSLAELWRARLAALDAPARLMAEAAAIAGGGVLLPPATLAEAAGVPADAMPDALDALVRAGLVAQVEGRVRLAAAGIAEVLTEGLAPDARRHIAGVLVSALLGVALPESGDGLAELPMDALTQAAWLAVEGGLDPAAGLLTAEAGRRALAMSAPREALRLLAAAAERLPETAEAARRLGVRLPIAEARRYLEQLADAIPDYEAAIAAAAEAGDGHAEAAAWIGLGKCRQMRTDYPGALAAYQAADVRAEAAGAAALRARAVVSLARLHLFQGRQAEAIATCLRAADLARAAHADVILSHALNLQAVLEVQADPDRVEAALALLDEALAISVRLGDRVGQGMALENLGNTQLAVGDLKAAGDAFARFGAVCLAIGTATEATMANLNRAIVLAELGELEPAVTLAEDVARRARLAGRRFLLGAALSVQGQAHWRAGDPVAAERTFDEALELADAIQNAMLEEHVRMLRLEAWLALGEVTRALDEAERLDALVAKTGHAEARARLAGHQAELARQRGEASALERAEAQVQDPNRVAAHRAHQIASAAALDLGRTGTAWRHAEAALAISRGWGSAWHEATSLVLAARTRLREGARPEAAALALQALDAEALGQAAGGPNPYARAGAALLLDQAGEPAQARAAAGHDLAALRGRFTASSPEAWPAMLQAQGLDGVDALARVTGGGTTGLAIDPDDFASCLEAIVHEDGEGAIMQMTLQAAMAMAQAERGYVLAYENGRLSQAVTQGLDYDQELAAGFSTSIVENVLYTGQALYLPDAGSDARWRQAQSVLALSLKTVVCVPLSTPTRILGVVYMDRQAIDPLLSAGDLALLRSLGTVAAATIFRERARLAEAGVSARMRLLADLGAAVALAPNSAYREVLLTASRCASAERAFWLVPGPESTWTAQAAFQSQGGALAFHAGMISQGIASFVSERRQALSLLDTSAAEDWQSRRSVQALGLRTVWCVPTGLSDGSVLYLDAERVAMGDPSGELATLEALLAYARPLLAP